MNLTLLPGGLAPADEAVLAVDWSLASTGMCRIYPDGIVAPWTITSTGKTDWTLKQRAERVRTVANRIAAAILSTDRVIVEGTVPSLGAQSGKEDLALLRGLVILDLLDRKISVDVMSPGTLKKWATGKGTAGKDQMSLHIGRLYPDVELANNNEVDAVGLAHASAFHQGYVVPTRAHHKEALLAAVHWEQ